MTSSSAKFWLSSTLVSSLKKRWNICLRSTPTQWKTSQSFSASSKLPKTKSNRDAATEVSQIHPRTCHMWRRVPFYRRKVSWMWSESKSLTRKKKMMMTSAKVIIRGRPLVSRLRREAVTWYKIGLVLVHSSKLTNRWHQASTLRRQAATTSHSMKTPHLSLTLSRTHAARQGEQVQIISDKRWKMHSERVKVCRVQFHQRLLTCFYWTKKYSNRRLLRTHNEQLGLVRKDSLLM